MAAGIMSVDYRILQKYAKPLMLLTLFCLILVLVPSIGKQSYGARRWFRLGSFYIQPSEFAKLAMLIYASDFLSRKQNKIKSFIRGFLPLMLVTGLLTGLILIQPDLGTSFLIGSTVFILNGSAHDRRCSDILTPIVSLILEGDFGILVLIARLNIPKVHD